ncbi:MAG: hypothetical protein ACP5II_01435 [Infirmifilum sp.]|uniref:Uncharacterized protein n=1 Tax=Infirmifilum uzonense TaxID=1550241 RepID=A0A0F7FHD1_9CREN|nr:hypothetical protein [Infirmifilum uzonense]AKG38215.1 hypothetical protein MA03_01445 [Infirmifilum uzonense]
MSLVGHLINHRNKPTEPGGEFSPLAIAIRQALLSCSEELLKEFSGLHPVRLTEKLEELLRRHDINVEVTLHPLSLKPFLLIKTNPFTLLLYTRSRTYEVWPLFREVSGTA